MYGATGQLGLAAMVQVHPEWGLRVRAWLPVASMLPAGLGGLAILG